MFQITKSDASASNANAGYPIAEISSTDGNQKANGNYQVRIKELTPKVYKAWILVGFLFMSGLIVIPSFYAVLLSQIQLPNDPSSGFQAFAAMFGSVIIGGISFGIGIGILVITGLVYWWKYG